MTIRALFDAYVLSHLNRSEVEKYIQSHLHYAGGSTEIFTTKALDVVAKESSGIPRMINRIPQEESYIRFSATAQDH